MFYDALAKFLRLRYRFMPYIYSVAGMVTHEDYTMMRALPFDFRCDANTYDIDDQFMFGPALLVNPVTQPMYYAAESTPLHGVSQSRTVYLPKGTDWYDFWTGKHYTGGQTIIANAPLATMPLYVRAGSIIPLGPDIQYTGEGADAPIEFYIYTGQDAHFTLYEDEGDNYTYEQGLFARTPVSWDEQLQQFTIGSREGSYPGMPASREFRLIVVSEGIAQLDDAKALSLVYSGQKIDVDLSGKANG
jgi:alpha-D-xyloside xylohydrolase